MMKLVVLAVLAAVVAAAPYNYAAVNVNSMWEEYKVTFGKTYATGMEERMRFDNFVANTATAAHKLSDQSAAEREVFKHSALSKIEKTTKPATPTWPPPPGTPPTTTRLPPST